MQLALSSTTQTHAEISRLAEDELADRFRAHRRRRHGRRQRLAAARAVGAAARARSCASTTCRSAEVVNALRAQNTTAPVGRGARARWTSRASASSAASSRRREFNDIVVKRSGDEIVRLGQVATVEDGFAELDELSACATAQPNVGIVDHALARREHGRRRQRGARAWSRRSTRRCPQGTKLEVTHDGGKDAAEQPEQRDRSARSSAPCSPSSWSTRS